MNKEKAALTSLQRDALQDQRKVDDFVCKNGLKRWLKTFKIGRWLEKQNLLQPLLDVMQVRLLKLIAGPKAHEVTPLFRLLWLVVMTLVKAFIKRPKLFNWFITYAQGITTVLVALYASVALPITIFGSRSLSTNHGLMLMFYAITVIGFFASLFLVFELWFNREMPKKKIWQL